MRPVVHVIDPIHPTALARLSEQADVLHPEDPFPSHCDGVIVRASKVTASQIAACPNLQVIGKHGAGLDAIDVDAASKRGIRVVSTPGANAVSVSELAIGFALSLIRNTYPVSESLRAGRPIAQKHLQGYEIRELRIGVFGLGAVGSGTARRLIMGFEARVMAFDPGIAPVDWPADIERCADLETLVSNSDLLFLHAPLLPSTRHCINERTIALMPSGAYIVNCARGGIVDEGALARALHDGHIAGAASDVFEDEPPTPDNPLLACQTFIGTPHLGAATNGALSRVGFAVVDEVMGVLNNSRNGCAGLPVSFEHGEKE